MINPLVTRLTAFLAGALALQTPVPSLTLVGRGRVSAIYDIEAVPPYAFALENGILNVLDVRNPATVKEVGSLAFDRGRSRTALRFPYLYLTGFNEPLGVIDISTPTRPRWVAEFPELGPTASGGFELAGDVAYSVRIQRESGQAGELFLDVLDLAANPARPARTGTINLGVRVQGEFGGIAQAGGRAFVLVRRPAGETSQSRLIVVDTRVPGRPTIERTLAFPEGAFYRNLEIRGDVLYLAQAESPRDPRAGLAIYRLAAGGLERLGEALSPELAIPIDLIVRDDVVYMTFKSGGLVATFDVATPRAPRLVDRYQQTDMWAAGLGMALVEDRLYVSGDNGPSPILDVRTARTPRLIGRYEFEGGSVDRLTVDGNVVMLRSLTDLIFYDVSDPAAPRRVGVHHGPIPAYDPTTPFNLNMVAATRDGRTVVTYGSLLAQILDGPGVLAAFTSRGLVHAIALTPTHAILGHERRGSGAVVAGAIQVVALRATRAVETVGSLDVEQPPIAMAVHGSRLVVLLADGTLAVVDLGEPTRPVLQGRYATAGSAPSSRASGPWHLALSEDGRRAYVSGAAVVGAAPARTGRGVLVVIDLQTPTDPRVVGQLEIVTSGDTAIPLAVVGRDVLLLAGSAGGVVSVDVSEPSRPAVSGTYSLPPFIYYANDIAADREHIYVGAGEDGLLVFRRPTGLASPYLAQWTKTIDCPDGTVYRDVRRDAGRGEFCERLLPGSLKVQDGPSRSWYSQGRLGEEGSYTNGRKIGKWKECDRFDRCQERAYELISSQEQERGVKPGVPLGFANGRYVFDFGSCWSTWVTRQTPDAFTELNIGSGLIRCQVTYMPSTEKDRAAGNQGHYLCEVPYSVGVRAFNSVDLRSELPKAGLPQFCRKDDPPVTEPMPDGPPAQAFAIWVNHRVLDSRTKQQARSWTTLANVVDVECAAVNRRPQGPDVLSVRLNEYSEKLVLERLGKDETKVDACGGRLPLTALATTRDAAGRTLFNYALSGAGSTAERQRACIASQLTLQPTCTGR